MRGGDRTESPLGRRAWQGGGKAPPNGAARGGLSRASSQARAYRPPAHTDDPSRRGASATGATNGRDTHPLLRRAAS